MIFYFCVFKNNQQPKDDFGEDGCMCADNKNKGKWSIESCDSRHPFICAHIEKDDDFFTCKLQSEVFELEFVYSG